MLCPLGLGLLALGIGIACYEPELAPWDDNAQFIVVAKSIVSQQGLREINHPARPLHQKFPVGFPLMLAAVERISADAFQAMKGCVLALFVLSTVLVYWLAWPLVGRVCGVAVAALFCSNQLALQFASEVMSEVPFLCFSLLAVLLHREEEHAANVAAQRWFFVAALLASIWALLLRSVGVALIGALALHTVLRRRYLRAALLVMAAAVTLGTQRAVLDRGNDDYLTQLLLVDYYDAAKGYVSWGGLAERALSNLTRYSLDLIPRAVVPWHGLRPLLWLIALGLGIGLLRALWRREALAFYFGGMLLLLLAWPRVWAVPRFLLPVLPVMLLWLVHPVGELGAWIRRRWSGLPAWIGPPTMFVLVLALALPNLAAARRYHPERDDRWRQYVRAMDWLREHTAAEAVVMCRKPYLGFLYSKRRTVPTVRSSDEGEFYRQLEGSRVSYVVVDSLPLPGTRENVIPNIKKRRQRYELVYRAQNPPLWVFRYLGGASTPLGRGELAR